MDAILPDSTKLQLETKSTPDTCPICRMSGTMARLPGAYVRFRDGFEHLNTLQLIYRCPRHKCGAVFIAEYEPSWSSRQYDPWEFSRAFPMEPQSPTVSPEISTLSPSFYGLFKQALAAEHHGLTDVFGMALRKALEFLIKDYAISKHPTKDAAIKAALLGPVIKEYVSDPNIKSCAERAVWLGNDETHYERRWTGHDVTDLKTLIQLTLNWIVNEQLTAKYLGAMTR
jgi:hypothetical protein